MGKEGTGSGWYLEQSCGTEREGGGEDFTLRPGGERRRLMRSTSLTTTPLSIRPTFPGYFSTAHQGYFPQLNRFYETRTSSFTPKSRQRSVLGLKTNFLA